MDRTLVLLVATLFAAPFAQAQAPLERPNEGETEFAPPGRTSTTFACAVTTIEFYWAAGLEGTIQVVQAGGEGASHFSQTTPSECKDTATSYSDTLAKCQGLPVEGSFCQNDAYEVTQRVWESSEIDPCPSQNLLDRVFQFIASGGASWPGCSELVEMPPVKHQSAQQCNCTGTTAAGASGAFMLVTGDPTLAISTPVPDPLTPLEQLRAAFQGSPTLELHPAMQAYELEPIAALSELTLESRTTWFEPTGVAASNRRRTLFGSFAADGRFRFESPQLAIDADTGEAVPFLETWVRDERALYQWIQGQRRGMINPVQAGLADAYQALTYPELDAVQAWLNDPLRLLRGPAVTYATSTFPNGSFHITQSLGTQFPFDRATRVFQFEAGAGFPSASMIVDAQGHTTQVTRYSELRELAPGVLRPMTVEIETYAHASDTLQSLQWLHFRSATIAPAEALDLSPPTPPSEEWNLELHP